MYGRVEKTRQTSSGWSIAAFQKVVEPLYADRPEVEKFFEKHGFNYIQRLPGKYRPDVDELVYVKTNV